LLRARADDLEPVVPYPAQITQSFQIHKILCILPENFWR